MPELTSLLTFAAIALGMVLTPGPNMVYLISRSICQGQTAGLISLGGVALGFVPPVASILQITHQPHRHGMRGHARESGEHCDPDPVVSCHKRPKIAGHQQGDGCAI
jgi:hypothetical protein